MRFSRIGFIVILAVIFTACRAGEVPLRTPSSTPIASEATNTQTTATVVVEYRRAGGLVGFDDHLVVYSDRGATLSRANQHYQFVLDQSEFDQLNQLLGQADFSQFMDDHRLTPLCCDLIEYSITYQGQTATVMDTQVPPDLQPIFDLLDRIIVEHAGGG